jgi:hypothetical protein
MATIEWQQKKETFNTEKNYFDITYITVSRETSEEEDRLELLLNRFNNLSCILGVIAPAATVLGGIILASLELWVAFGIVLFTSIVGMIVFSVVFSNKAQDYAIKLDKYIKDNDVWNTLEVQEIKRYNKEQNEFADKWRAEHPLEEKIRACLLDPKSSVDVANLARYYAEKYLTGQTHEIS